MRRFVPTAGPVVRCLQIALRSAAKEAQMKAIAIGQARGADGIGPESAAWLEGGTP